MGEDPQTGRSRQASKLQNGSGGRSVRRRDVLSGLGTAALAGLAGCASLLPEAEAEGDRTVIDVAGRDVDVPEDPERILGIGPGALRQLAYMDAADRVVGADDIRGDAMEVFPYLVANPELGDLPTFGDSGMDRDGDAEQILEVEPDAIFLNGGSARAEELTERTNTPVVLVDTANIMDDEGRDVLYETWETIGETLGKDARAGELETFLEDTVADFEERTGDVPDDERAEGYAGAFRFRGAHGISTTRGDTTMFHYPNVENAIEDVESHQNSVDLSHEQLLEADPDRIFIDVASVERVREELEENPELEALSAVEDGEVYPVLQVYLDMRNFGSMIANAYFVGKTSYPDRFDDIDLETQVDDVFEGLLGERIYGDHLRERFPDVYRPLS